MAAIAAREATIGAMKAENERLQAKPEQSSAETAKHCDECASLRSELKETQDQVVLLVSPCATQS